jgi:hypothetical protein
VRKQLAADVRRLEHENIVLHAAISQLEHKKSVFQTANDQLNHDNADLLTTNTELNAEKLKFEKAKSALHMLFFAACRLTLTREIRVGRGRMK